MASRRRILVVDDDPASRSLLDAILGVDYEVLVAADGEIAVRMFHEHAPHLVITDIFMPDMDGVRVIEQLRAAAPGAKIIAVSAGWRVARLEIGPGHLERNDGMHDALTAGADLALSKPLDAEVVREAVETLLGE